MMIDKSMRMTLRQLRTEDAVVDGKRVPKSVAFLHDLATQAGSADELDDVLFHLAGEYAMAGMIQEQAATLVRRTENLPSDVNTWLSLADCLSGLPGRETEARAALGKGIAAARSSDEFIRTAFGVQARIARRWRDAQLYQEALRHLIADAGRKREVDQLFEPDLVQDLPPGLCPPSLVAEYLELGGRADD